MSRDIQRSLCLRALCRVSPQDSIPLPPSDPQVTRPLLGVPSSAPIANPAIYSHLPVFSVKPYCTTSFVYISSKRSQLCVLVGAVLCRQDLHIRWGATMRRSGDQLMYFHQSNMDANGRSARGGWRRSPLDIMNVAAANGFHR